MTLSSKRFITVDYEAALDLVVSLRECLPSDHLARFVVDIVAQLDLSCIYVHYGTRGGKAYGTGDSVGLTVLRLCHRGVQFAENRKGHP